MISLPPIKTTLTLLLITCLLAPISFDIGSVPITFQTLILFTIAATFGEKIGLWVSLLYLLIGAFGLPVFGNFTGGYEKLIGPTSGFLWAFPLVSFYIGWDLHRKESNFLDHILVFFRGHALLLIPGFIVLYFTIEGIKIWPTLVSLLPGLLIKTIAGGLLSYYLKKKQIPLP